MWLVVPWARDYGSKDVGLKQPVFLESSLKAVVKEPFYEVNLWVVWGVMDQKSVQTGVSA